jgi:hypothetical protein
VERGESELHDWSIVELPFKLVTSFILIWCCFYPRTLVLLLSLIFKLVPPGKYNCTLSVGSVSCGTTCRCMIWIAGLLLLHCSHKGCCPQEEVVQSFLVVALWKKSASRMSRILNACLATRWLGLPEKLVQQGHKVKRQHVYLHFWLFNSWINQMLL